jgi:hypothetical protein
VERCHVHSGVASIVRRPDAGSKVAQDLNDVRVAVCTCLQHRCRAFGQQEEKDDKKRNKEKKEKEERNDTHRDRLPPQQRLSRQPTTGKLRDREIRIQLDNSADDPALLRAGVASIHCVLYMKDYWSECLPTSLRYRSTVLNEILHSLKQSI